MYACLCIHINYTTQHIIATRTGTGAVLINKRDERCTLRLGVHYHHLRSALEQSATKRRYREIPGLHDTVRAQRKSCWQEDAREYQDGGTRPSSCRLRQRSHTQTREGQHQG
jgi:hypothetical protein